MRRSARSSRDSRRRSPALLAAGGAFVNAFADYDGDGDPDLFVGFNGTPNRLYRNDRGTFADVAAAAGVADARPTRAAAWGDCDADGDPDLLLGFTPGAGSVLRLYRNDGGRFTDITAAAGLVVDAGAVRQPAWIDVDADGDLDLFVAFRDKPNALFRNDRGRSPTSPRPSASPTRARPSAPSGSTPTRTAISMSTSRNMDGDANGLYPQRRRDASPTSPSPPDWRGATARRATPPTAPCGRARPTSTATAGSIS